MTRWVRAPNIDWGISDELLFIDGVGKGILQVLKDNGIETLEDLILTELDCIETDTVKISHDRLVAWKRQAIAVKERRLEIEAPPPNPDGMLFIDLEMGGRASSIVWLVGVYDYSANEYRHFLAKMEHSEKGMFRKFLEYLESRDEKVHTICTYSGNHMDYNLMLKRLEYHDLDKGLVEAFKSYDLCRDTKGRMGFRGYFPNYKLKTLGRLFGYTWKHKKDMDGRVVAAIWNRHQKAPERYVPWRKMIDYNRDDVLSMVHIMKGLKEIWETGEEL